MINLSKREKRLLFILGGVLTVFVIYWIISSIIDFKSSISDEFDSNLKKVENLQNIYDKYRVVLDKKKKYNDLLKNNKSVSTLIEEHAQATNIQNNKVYNRDRPGTVQNKFTKVTTDVKFEGVDIKSVLDFIYKMENSNVLLKINYLRIRQAIRAKNTYDVTIKFDSYSLK